MRSFSDLCTDENIPEIELISLVEEQLPKYNLRADIQTGFLGYEGADWFISAPSTRSDKLNSNLTTEQIRQTLNYFVLSGDRVSQMTRTYDDVDAVTKLLEEKEKDLELAAHIGQNLLVKNKALEERLVSLDLELSTAHEAVTQLRHDLFLKTELLQLYTNDLDESSSDGGTPLGLRSITFDLLQRKVKGLEEDNKQLRCEASQIARDTSEIELKEQQLLQELVAQLSDASTQVKLLTVEINKKYEENIRQQDQIAALLAQVAEFKARSKGLTVENEELILQLNVARECQNELATELADLKDRYAEVYELLRETQEHLKRQGKKSVPTVRLGAGSYHSLNPSPQPPSLLGPDSLAAELAFSSLGSEDSVDSGISSARSVQGPYLHRVFETVKCVHRAQETAFNSPFKPSLSSSLLSSPRVQTGLNSPFTPESTDVTLPPTPLASDAGENDQTQAVIEDYPSTSRHGVPGTPGTFDLNVALRRLDRANTLETPSTSWIPKMVRSSTYTTSGWRTPDSIMSVGSTMSTMSTSTWKLPEKLQIVKPMEGSVTLHNWSRLAQPHMGSILEERPGVTTKCADRTLGSIFPYDTYTLSDVEEDDEVSYPGKCFQSADPVYTFTNSVVKHPDDQTVMTSCLKEAHMSTGGAEPPSADVTDPGSRRGSACMTYSTNLSIARALHERGVGYSGRPGSTSPTDTVTPCNSPDYTPPPSPTGESPFYGGITDLFNQGAALFTRTLIGQVLDEKPRGRGARRGRRYKATPSDLQALSRINLMGKLEELGLEKMVPQRGVSPAALRQALEVTATASRLYERAATQQVEADCNRTGVDPTSEWDCPLDAAATSESYTALPEVGRLHESDSKPSDFTERNDSPARPSNCKVD